MAEQVRVLVSGLVQGVGFRHATYRQALREGVTGWVRNLPDGRVEAVFQGPPDPVDAMARWCEHGPGLARVDEIDVQREPAEADYESFEISF